MNMDMKGKGKTMEKIVLEYGQVEDLNESDAGVNMPSMAWKPLAITEFTDNRTPVRVRLRLTEWLEGAPFYPAIRLRPEPERPPTPESCRNQTN